MKCLKIADIQPNQGQHKYQKLYLSIALKQMSVSRSGVSSAKVKVWQQDWSPHAHFSLRSTYKIFPWNQGMAASIPTLPYLQHIVLYSTQSQAVMKRWGKHYTANVRTTRPWLHSLLITSFTSAELFGAAGSQRRR